MIGLIHFLSLIVAAAAAQSSAGASASSPSSPAASSQPSGSGSCSSSNIAVDPCLTSTTWTLDDDSTKQLIQSKEAAIPAVTITSLDVAGSGTISFTSNSANWAYDNLVVNLGVEVEGIDVETTTTINGFLDADLYMTSDSSFCMHVTDGQGSADIQTSISGDEVVELTPDGGFIGDDYVFDYTCTANSLSIQGNLNGQIVVGPFYFTGDGPGPAPPVVACNSKTSGSTSCSTFNWGPLVQKACSDYTQAKATAPNTLGYFGQVLNIVCAASKSSDACCSDMFPYYNTPGCQDDWSGPFEQYVFSSFLGPDSPDFSQVKESIYSGTGSAFSFIPIPGIGSGDWGTLFAGGDHFINNLAGPFQDYIGNLVAQYVASCDLAGLDKAINELAAEHESLFSCAVLPGFQTEFARGQISKAAASIAQVTVPIAARSLRKNAIVDALTGNLDFLGCLAKSIFRRDTSGSVTPSDLQNVAEFNNLTIPSNPAFQADYRTWVETTQPVLSTANLPDAYYQILPAGADVVVDVQLSDSAAGVMISADRSSFPSEAVIAVTLCPLDPTDPSAPQQYPNTSLAIFGDVVLVAPATLPVGDNAYLFNNLTDPSVSQALNESSVFDDGYNVLFDTFDVALSFDAPAPAPLSSLVVVDLVSGTALPSAWDPTSGAVVARGIQGHGASWGGGGVYAVGYASSGSVSATTVTPITLITPITAGAPVTPIGPPSAVGGGNLSPTGWPMTLSAWVNGTAGRSVTAGPTRAANRTGLASTVRPSATTQTLLFNSAGAVLARNTVLVAIAGVVGAIFCCH